MVWPACWCTVLHSATMPSLPEHSMQQTVVLRLQMAHVSWWAPFQPSTKGTHMPDRTIAVMIKSQSKYELYCTVNISSGLEAFSEYTQSAPNFWALHVA